MDSNVMVTALARLSGELGGVFNQAATLELAEQLSVLQRANAQRIRDLAGALGMTESDDRPLDGLGWVLTMKEAARFIAIGNETKHRKEQGS